MAAGFDELLEIAVDNHGYVTVREAEAAGLDPAQLRKLLAARRLERSSHGVYRIPILASGPHAVYAEALAWTGRRGVISHESALDLMSLCDVNPARIHLTVPATYAPRRRGGELYRVWRRHLPDVDLTQEDGIATTRAFRSIGDCLIMGTDPRQLELACRNGLREGYLREAEHDVMLARVQSSLVVEARSRRTV